MLAKHDGHPMQKDLNGKWTRMPLAYRVFNSLSSMYSRIYICHLCIAGHTFEGMKDITGHTYG